MNLMIDMTLKVSAIVLLALGARHLLRRRSASTRHWVLAVGFACAAASPLLAQITPVWSYGFPAVSSVVVPPASVVPSGPTGDAQGTVSRTSETSITLSTGQSFPALPITTRQIVLIWIVGVAIGLVILAVGLGRLTWIASRSRPASGKWVQATAGARVLETEHPALLVTWGLLRPKILLPAGAQTWTGSRLQIVLAHEMAHIQRRDWVIQFGAELFRCLHWFNPIVWMGCRALREESEKAADDAVLRMGVEGTTYATHLLDLARMFQGHRRGWMPAVAIARSSGFERRVTAMLNRNTDREPVTPLVRATALIALLAVTIVITGFDVVAQARFATVSGSVTDQSGAIVPKVTLVLANAQTNAKQEVNSDGSGHFEFVGVPAGEYGLEARLPGFETYKEDVRLGVGESLQKDLTLMLGTVEEAVGVSGSAARRDAGGANSPAPRSQGPRPCPNPEVGGCVHPPVKLKDVRPVYPAELMGSGSKGTVVIAGLIGLDGHMKDMHVIDAPLPAFEQAALDAVGQWEFRPTRLNDRVVETRITVRVSFGFVPPPPAPSTDPR